MARRRYTVVGRTDHLGDDLYGQTHAWCGDDVIMGQRAYMETAHDLMWRTTDAKDSIYVYAFVRDNEDGMVVATCEREEVAA